MFIDKDSVISNGISLGQYIVEAKFGYHKLWSPDSGRALSGKQSGTLLGIYPKITVQFRKLTKEELEIIAPLLDSARQATIYDDPNKKTKVTLSTYTGDWEVVTRGLMQNEGFSCAFISTDKRR